MESFYDAIIIGPHFGGLLAAALLVKRGKKVLMIRGIADGDEEAEKYLALKTSSSIFSELGGISYLRRAFEELAATPGKTQVISAVEPSLQMVLPGYRIDLFHDGISRSLRFFAGDYLDRVEGFLKKLGRYGFLVEKYFKHTDPDLSAGKRSRFYSGLARFFTEKLLSSLGIRGFTGRLEKLDVDEDVKSFLLVIAMARSHLFNEDVPVASASCGLDILRSGSYIFNFAKPQVDEILYGFISERGGEIVDDAEISEVMAYKGEVKGVVLDEGEHVCRCDHLIVNGPLRWFVERSRLELPRRFLKKRVSSLEPVCFDLFLHIKMKEEAVPVGMSHYLILVKDLAGEPVGDNVISVVMLPQAEKSPEEGDLKNIIANCKIYFSAGDSIPCEKIEEVREKILSSLRQLMPFSFSSIVEISHYPAADLYPYRLPPWLSVVYGPAFKPLLGLSLIKHRLPYYKNVLVTSDDLFPGLGPDGPVVSGCFVANLISRRVPLFLV